MPHNLRACTGAGSQASGYAGAGRAYSESDRAGAPHAAGLERSRTHEGWTGAGRPKGIPA
jgi:hypothetical protein